jgi:hypothetical protein
MQTSSFLSSSFASFEGTQARRLHQQPHGALNQKVFKTSQTTSAQTFGGKKWLPFLGFFLLSLFNLQAAPKSVSEKLASLSPLVTSASTVQPDFIMAQGRWPFNLLPNDQHGQSGVSFAKVAETSMHFRTTRAPVDTIKSSLPSEIFKWAVSHQVIPNDPRLQTRINAIIQSQYNGNSLNPKTERSFAWATGNQTAYLPAQTVGFALKTLAEGHKPGSAIVDAWSRFRKDYPLVVADMLTMSGKALLQKPESQVIHRPPLPATSPAFEPPVVPTDLYGWAFNLMPSDKIGVSGVSFSEVAQGKRNGVRTTFASSDVLTSDLGTEIFKWALKHRAIPSDERLRVAIDNIVKSQANSAADSPFRTPTSFIWTRAQDESGDFGFLPAHIALKALQLVDSQYPNGPFKDALAAFNTNYSQVASEVDAMDQQKPQWWFN